MKLELINDLNESQQYRTRDAFKNFNAREIADHAFLDLIVLWILYNEFDYAPIATNYARKTVSYGSFKNYRQSGTDLYMTLNVLQNGDADFIYGDGADNTLLSRIRLPDMKIKKYLTDMANNRLQHILARNTLHTIERKLYVDDSTLRSVRRLAQDWPNLNQTQRALVVTRLLQFYRTHARRSELFGFLQDYARTKQLEIRNANNAEVPKSKTASTIATAAALGAAGYAGFQLGRKIGKGLV